MRRVRLREETVDAGHARTKRRAVPRVQPGGFDGSAAVGVSARWAGALPGMPAGFRPVWVRLLRIRGGSREQAMKGE